jgi:demethylmenaquinone methyltransferase/2-methoxy-6-polyprenyl-1,4-benzoquinol methylase
MEQETPVCVQDGKDWSKELSIMFSSISARYDLLNRLITFGQDRAWRRRVVERAALPLGGRLLDIGTGTGGIAWEALRRDPSLLVIAADCTIQMMVVGRQRAGADKIYWCSADAPQLPFPSAVFDAVVSGYLIRNVENAVQAFEEQMRVTKTGGRVVCLDTSPPSQKAARPVVVFYLRFVMPLLGQLIARNRGAYEYLSSSTQAFMRPDELASAMRNAGLVDVQHERFMAGTQVIVSGIRP